jgi:hypothetical protein
MGKRAYRGVDHCKDRIPYVLPFLSSSLLNAFSVRGCALFDQSFRVASPQGSPVSSHRRRHRKLYNQWPIDGPVIGLLVLGHGHRLALERRNIYSGFARCAQSRPCFIDITFVGFGSSTSHRTFSPDTWLVLSTSVLCMASPNTFAEPP